MFKFLLLLIAPFLIVPVTFARDDAHRPFNINDQNPPSIGNFALPDSQQPGPFLSFGQNIVDTGNAQLFVTPAYIKPPPNTFSASILYGFTNTSSLYISVPNAGDPSVQGEYAFFNDSIGGKYAHEDQATIVGAITLPSNNGQYGTSYYGSPTFFVGTTLNRTYIRGLIFLSPGVLFTTNKRRNQYYYQGGVGYNLFSETNEFIWFALLELDGIYSQKDHFPQQPSIDTTQDVINISGGNTVLLTPSIWYSTKRLIVQLGVSFPVAQQLTGNQNLLKYSITGNIGWTFN